MNPKKVINSSGPGLSHAGRCEIVITIKNVISASFDLIKSGAMWSIRFRESLQLACIKYGDAKDDAFDGGELS